MTQRRKFHSSYVFVVMAWLAAFVLAGSAFASDRVLYAFKGGNDGIGSNNLIADRNGNLFGTTFNGGGSSGAGTVYELSPPAQLGGAWSETVLYSFSYANLLNGIGPLAGLVMDTTGNLYGTTWLGGSQGSGVAFELSPPAVQGGTWSYTVLFNFGANLTSPEAPMVLDKAGNLYGTTVSGGTGGCAGGCGGVFQLVRPKQGGSWMLNLLYSFSGSFEGGGGTSAGVVFGSDGALYGTTYLGSGGAAGTVFRLAPPQKGAKQWVHTVLYAFLGGVDGSNPQSGVVFDKSGNLYGITSIGGTGGANCFGLPCGTIYQLAPTTSGSWTHTVIYSFDGINDGGIGTGGQTMVFDASGNLLGTTPMGGNPSCSSGLGCGTVFELSPPAVQGGSWTEVILDRFSGGSDGLAPGGLAFGKGHQLYGAAGAGANGDGLVFSIAP